MSSQSNPNTEPNPNTTTLPWVVEPTEAGEEFDSWTPERHDQTITLEEYHRVPQRQQSHERQRNLVQHRGQTQEVQGGRTAARQQGLTDSSRGRGRAVPRTLPKAPSVIRIGLSLPEPGPSDFAKEVLVKPENYRDPEAKAREKDPILAKPLPRNHPSVVAEANLDRLNLLMQPGSNDEIDQRLSSGIGTAVTRDGRVVDYDEGLIDADPNDPDDDWIS